MQHLEDADGVHTHDAALGLVPNDEAHIRAALDALVGKPVGPGGVPNGLRATFGARETDSPSSQPHAKGLHGAFDGSRKPTGRADGRVLRAIHCHQRGTRLP